MPVLYAINFVKCQCVSTDQAPVLCLYLPYIGKICGSKHFKTFHQAPGAFASCVFLNQSVTQHDISSCTFR